MVRGYVHTEAWALQPGRPAKHTYSFRGEDVHQEAVAASQVYKGLQPGLLPPLPVLLPQQLRQTKAMGRCSPLHCLNTHSLQQTRCKGGKRGLIGYGNYKGLEGDFFNPILNIIEHVKYDLG